MPTTTHIRLALVALVTLAVSAGATLRSSAPAVAAPARQSSSSYSWPVKPFDQPHPVRGNFGDPRTIFAGPPTQQTLLGGAGVFQFHDGVDISAADGSAVYPVESGTVTTVVSSPSGTSSYVAVA